jgi:hypothetical protein
LCPRLLFGGFEELLAVPLSSERLRHPEEGEVKPPSPDIAKNAAEDRASFVTQEDGERTVVSVPG